MPASWFTNRNTSVPGIPPIIKVEDVPDISSMVQDTDGPEPIAIVGIGCRLPGDVSTASECWDFLRSGKNARGEFPTTRFNIDAFYSSRRDTPGCLFMRGGYFLNQDIKNFDNAFFGINNLEATHMDPQQRNLLEVVYECLESAGIRLEDVAGSNIGCYVGDFVYDYLVMQAKDDEEFHRYSPTGKGRTLLSNRISHTFDFRGPSMTLDTACSSSLYCLHTACRALLQGDCDAAVVASANLIQTPEQQMDVAASGVLSPTSACHTFDASADGYGRADAIGALYLKRLSDAIRDNDPIRSIIRATSTNSNGQTPGITLPSAKCQEAVIRKAYEFARLDPRETDYFECHGTGTPVGDPIEISAVAHFRASYASPDDYKECLIGSVKPNFGHSEAASGITSIIKATLALEHLQLPATIGIQTLNPAVPWKDYNLSVVRTLAQWPRADKDHIPRISVNSFGYGGANAHCILDNADAWIDHLLTLNKNIEIKKSRDENRVRRGINDEQAFLLPFSARNDTCATRRLDDTGSMKLEPDQLPDLAYTLSARRSTFEYRRFAVARSSSWSLDFKTASNSGYSQVVNTDNVPLIFVFTGQGSQWPQMGRRLFEVYSVFRNSILKLDHYLRSLPRSPSWSLIDVIFNDDTESIHHPSISQTACTAIQIALVDILRRWNVIPASVIGHSSGEICAAYAAGHISATYAIEIAYLRGLVVSTNTAAGCMIAASISFDDAQELIKELDLGLQACVACRNSPTNVTLSGDKYAIDLLHEALQSRGRFSRRLKTGGQAYHSHYMKKLGDMYEQLLRDALYRETSAMKYFPKQHPSCVSSLQVSMVSTVLKRPISYREAMDPAYWRANLESPVLFDIAVESLLTDQPQVFVEIGPHHALQMPVHQIEANHRAQGTQSKYYSALVRNRCSEMTALTLAGNLWTVGYDLDFEAVRQSYRWSSNSKPKVLNDLPNYSWDHSTILWKEPRVSAEYRNRQFPRDELIGSKVVGSNGRTETWRSMLDLANMSWLVEHKLGANVVLPGACYISMASRACQQLLSSTHQAKALEFRNVHIEKVMVLRHDSRLEVFTELRPLRLTSLVDHIFTWEFIISSMGNNRQTRHASGCIQALGAMDLISIPDVTIESSLERQSSRLWYSQFARQRLEFGSAFQSMESLFVPRKHDQMVAEAELKKLAENNLNEHRHLYPFDVHPIITDAAFQTGLVATARGEIEQLLGRVPVSIGRLHIFRTNSEDPYQIFRTKASAKVIGPGSALGQCQLLDRTGDTVLQVENIKVAPLQEMEIISMNRSSILKPVWIPDLSKLGQHNVEELCNIFPVGEPLKDSEVSTQFDSIKKIKQTISPNCKILYVGNLDQASYSPVFSTADTDGSNSSTKYTIGIPQNQGEICCLALTDERLPEPAEFVNYGFSLSAHEIKYDLIFLEDTSIRYDPRATDIRLLYMHLQPGGFILSSVKSLNDDASDSGIFLDDSASDGEKELDAFTNNLSNVLDVATIDLPTTKEGYHLTMALRSHYHTAPQEATIVILVQDLLHPLNASLLQTMQGNGFNTRIVLFNDVSVLEIQESSTIIVTAELERPIVANATKDQFTQIQLIASYASKVIWISGGRLVLASSPDYCAVLGLSRSIMAGNPAIQFAVLDIDETRLNISHTIANIQAIIEAMSDPGTDLEYLQKNGLLYISRLLPETTLNDDFDQKKKGTSKVVEIANTVQYELHIRDPGQFDTLEFRHAPFSDKLPSDHLVVLVKATGMNAKDLYTLSGKVDTVENTCSCEFSGIVMAVGSSVTGFVIGDRIVSSAPGRYRLYERVPASVCYKLKDDEDFVQLASVPMVFGTAIHALRNLANLQAGESVLIHSAAGGVGTAAILLAKSIGAEIYATVGNEQKKSHMIEQYGIDASHIFNSRDTSFLPAILKATNGTGVDVVLNSLTGTRLHASLEACAKFGRFIEIGKRDILDQGSLNMQVFQKGITFSAFDLHELYYSRNPKYRLIYEQLLVDAVQFYRTLAYAANTTISFDISDISSAFRFFAKSSRIGKVAITYNDPHSLVPVVAPKFKTQFSADKSYLLIGCLGGLGRSISRYMLHNGARHFTFLGRSGTGKPAAAMLVADLENAGASVKVMTGDVCNLTDVQAAVQALTSPLGGVIQAAMGLSEAHFPAMTHSAWQTALNPKILGTWNIHSAIASHEKDLDFFLMTSSIAGTIGFSTEANYCVANCFLDHFAAFRRKAGLKAVSVALGPVAGAGIVHEHPEIEAVFFRGGITEISEDDMLCVIDIALSRQDEIAHVITGLEPERAKLGFEDGWEMLAPDPRLTHITAAHNRMRSSSSGHKPYPSASAGSTIDSRLAAGLEGNSDEKSLASTLHIILAEQLAKLVSMESEKIGPQMYLADIGMDSTLAAQFRTYVFRATGVDVSFVTLMDGKCRMKDLVRIASESLRMTDSR